MNASHMIHSSSSVAKIQALPNGQYYTNIIVRFWFEIHNGMVFYKGKRRSLQSFRKFLKIIGCHNVVGPHIIPSQEEEEKLDKMLTECKEFREDFERKKNEYHKKWLLQSRIIRG